MPYKINNVQLLLEPSKPKPILQEPVGEDLAGQSIYPSKFRYELYWGLMDPISYAQILGFWQAQERGDEMSADLPFAVSGSWQFYTCNDIILDRPTADDGFTGYLTNVKMVVKNVRP